MLCGAEPQPIGTIMQSKPQAIRERLKHRAAESVPAPPPILSDSAQAAVRADEDDPSRVAPSAEGATTFEGLPSRVRAWLARELDHIGRRPPDAGKPR